MVADSYGPTGDSIFTAKSANGHTELTLTMHSRAHKLLAGWVNLFIKGWFRKGVESDIDAVKAYCEKQ